MSLGTTIYNTIFKRNSVFVGTVFATAFFYDLIFNNTVNNYFDSINKGKQWKDIRHRYITKDEEDDDE